MVGLKLHNKNQGLNPRVLQNTTALALYNLYAIGRKPNILKKKMQRHMSLHSYITCLYFYSCLTILKLSTLLPLLTVKK
jgi:hypothetical protein